MVLIDLYLEAYKSLAIKVKISVMIFIKNNIEGRK